MFLGHSTGVLGSEVMLYVTVAVQESMQINAEDISLNPHQQGKQLHQVSNHDFPCAFLQVLWL